jgi:hypothetical protein
MMFNDGLLVSSMKLKWNANLQGFFVNAQINV